MKLPTVFSVLALLIGCDASPPATPVATPSTSREGLHPGEITLAPRSKRYVAGEEEGLFRTFSGFISRDGHVFLGDSGNQRILRVSPDSGIVEFGRAGQGPGEFEYLAWIAPLGPDSLAAFDGMTSRLSVFSRGGALGSASTFPRDDYSAVLRGWPTDDGGFLVSVTRGIDPRDGIGVFQDSVRLMHWDRIASPRLLAGPFPHVWWRVVRTPRSYRTTALSHGPETLLAARNNRIVVAGNDVAGALLLDGRVREVRRLQAVTTPTSGVEVEGIAVPGRFYDHVVLGTNGDTWLAESHTFPDSTSGGESRTVLRFDRHGEPAGGLALPANARLLFARGEALLVRVVDDVGVERIELWNAGAEARK